MGVLGRDLVAEALADAIPAGVGLALVGRAKNPAPWSLLAAILVQAVSHAWSAALEAGSLATAFHELSRLFAWAYEGWTGVLLVAGGAIGFTAAARLKGTLLEGLALAAPMAACEVIFYSLKLPTLPLLPIPVHVAGLTVFLPLAERIAVRAFVFLGIREPDASFGAPTKSE